MNSYMSATFCNRSTINESIVNSSVASWIQFTNCGPSYGFQGAGPSTSFTQFSNHLQTRPSRSLQSLMSPNNDIHRKRLLMLESFNKGNVKHPSKNPSNVVPESDCESDEGRSASPFPILTRENVENIYSSQPCSSGRKSDDEISLEFHPDSPIASSDPCTNQDCGPVLQSSSDEEDAIFKVPLPKKVLPKKKKKKDTDGKVKLKSSETSLKRFLETIENCSMNGAGDEKNRDQFEIVGGDVIGDRSVTSKKRAPIMQSVLKLKKQDSLNASSSIMLKDWNIKRLRKDKVRVEGIVMSGKFEGKLWESNAIVKRIDKKTIQTKSGSTYVLNGSMGVDPSDEKSFDRKIFKLFANGFPEDWKSILQLEKRAKPKNAMLDSFKQDLLNDSNVFGIRVRPNLKRPKLAGEPSFVSKKAKVAPHVSDHENDDDDLLVENLPKSSRGRIQIPRLRWWENEKVEAPVSYIMNSDQSILSISKPSSSEKKRNPRKVTSSEFPSFKYLNVADESKSKSKPKPKDAKKEGKRSGSPKNEKADPSNKNRANGNQNKSIRSNSGAKLNGKGDAKTVKEGGDNTSANHSKGSFSEDDLSLSRSSKRRCSSSGFYSEANLQIKIPSSIDCKVVRKSPASQEHPKKSSKSKVLKEKALNSEKPNAKKVKKSSAKSKSRGKRRDGCDEISTVFEAGDKKSDKENSNRVTAKKGTMKYKKQLMALIDNHNKDYEADMFENTNMTKNRDILKDMLQYEDEEYNVDGLATPVINPALVSLRPNYHKTPDCHSGITPSLLNALHKSDMDSYNHHRQKWKKKVSSPAKKIRSPKKKNNSTVSKNSQSSLSTDTFDVFEVGQKNDENETEDPQDYYFDDD